MMAKLKNMMNMPAKTTIKVSQELRSKLAEIGNKDETFEEVIWRLIRRAEPERSGEVATSKSSIIQYKRKKEFVELEAGILKNVGFEYEYNVPPKKEGEWELDIKILKVYYSQKSYNPSEFFGVDGEHKYFSDEFIKVYFKILADILIKDFGITKLKNFVSSQLLQILEWRKVYYENKLSKESFTNDVEDILIDLSKRQIDIKTRKQLGNSVVGC